MSRPSIVPYLEQLVAGGRRMAVASWAVVAIGLFALLILTVDPAYEAAHHWVEALLWACLAWFAFEWLARLVRAIRARRGAAYAFSAGGLVDAMAALAPPVAIGFGADARSAWLFGVFWLLKLVPGIPGLRRAGPGPVGGTGVLVRGRVLFLVVFV